VHNAKLLIAALATVFAGIRCFFSTGRYLFQFQRKAQDRGEYRADGGKKEIQEENGKEGQEDQGHANSLIQILRYLHVPEGWQVRGRSRQEVSAQVIHGQLNFRRAVGFSSDNRHVWMDQTRSPIPRFSAIRTLLHIAETSDNLAERLEKSSKRKQST
jgi:hypothetical protein